jgi:hypothetical protein
MRRPSRSPSAGVGSSSAWSCSPLSIVRCASIGSAWSLPQRPDHDRVTARHRHGAWWSSTQQHRNDRDHGGNAGLETHHLPGTPTASPQIGFVFDQVGEE